MTRLDNTQDTVTLQGFETGLIGEEFLLERVFLGGSTWLQYKLIV